MSLKLHNFSAVDPNKPTRGMGNGSILDGRVWSEWAHRPTDLAEAVARIRALGIGAEPPAPTDEDEEYDAIEGRILYREHRRYERDRELVKKKKAAVMKKTGRLACEVCDFESSEVFGVEGVIDVHHIAPLHIVGTSRTSMSDLVLVCPTCHRVLHKHRPIITPAELRAKR